MKNNKKSFQKIHLQDTVCKTIQTWTNKYRAKIRIVPTTVYTW
jgi:hypothetical protein